MSERKTLKLQTARKDHECTLCKKKIIKGDTYWRKQVFDDFDGEWLLIHTEKEHRNCELEGK